MNIMIRNEKILNLLGFERAPGCSTMYASMSVNMWLWVIWRRITDR